MQPTNKATTKITDGRNFCFSTPRETSDSGFAGDGELGWTVAVNCYGRK